MLFRSKQIIDKTIWKEYEFKGKPGDIFYRPPQISPYHYRLDWQIWFAAMGDYFHNPWVLHYVYKLLQNDEKSLSLIRVNPFEYSRPTFIKIDVYQYALNKRSQKTDPYWNRKYLKPFIPPVSLSTPEFRQFLNAYGWI